MLYLVAGSRPVWRAFPLAGEVIHAAALTVALLIVDIL